MGGMGRCSGGHGGVLGLSMNGPSGVRVETQGRCGLSAKKLPASPGEKRSIEMNPSLLSKDDVTLQQPAQTHTPSGSHKNHTCLPPTDQTWWKQEPMIDMDLNLCMDSPSGWVENYQDLSSWCSTGETTSYLWPTTDESTVQPVEYQGEIDFDLIKSEEIASVPLQDDSWGAESTGNMSLNLPPMPEDRWGSIMGNVSANGGLSPTAKIPEPVLVNDCWLLDIEHEEVVKGESESGSKTDSLSASIQQRPTLVETKQVQPNFDRRVTAPSNSFSDVRVKEEPLETNNLQKRASGAFGVPAAQKPSGKLWNEHRRETRPRKPMHSFKKLEQKEVLRSPVKVQASPSPPPKVTPQLRPKDRPPSPDLFEEVHRKVVAMTAKSAAAAAAAVKRENTPSKVQRAPTLPRLNLNIAPIIMDTEPGPGNSNQEISTPEVLKSFGDMGDGFDLLSYVFDDKVMTPPVPLDSGNPLGGNPFQFPLASHGKPSIQNLPGYRSDNPNYRVTAEEVRNSKVGVVRPRFSKKIEGEAESEEEKPSSSVVVQVQPQILPATTTYKEEIPPEPHFKSVKRKRQDSVVSDLNVRIDEPRTTRKKQLNYRRDDDETSLEDDDDDDDDYNMKDDENDEDFTLEPTSKRRKRRTSETSTASRRSRASNQSTRRNTQERRTSINESDRYRELRDRNNEASRKSRLTRKAREQELMVREKELAKENQILKVKSEEMENLVKRLREALLQSMMKK